MAISGITTVRAVLVASLLCASGCGRDPNNDSDFVVDAQTLITLDRTACMGMCPDYLLSVGGDGTVTFMGRRYVKVVGAASGQIPVADVQTLVDVMQEANYLNLSVPTDCTRVKTDQPMVTTSLAIAGTTHTVEHYHGNLCAPEVLTTIEDEIDIVAQSAQWVKCDTPSGYCP
jgi:hypothetical protein